MPNYNKAIATEVFALAAASFILIGALKKLRSKNDESSIYTIPTELKSGPYASELKLAVRLALEAGSNMNAHLDAKGTKAGEGSEQKLGISTKGNDADFATEIDVLNEKLIVAGIEKNFPKHEIIGEESTGTGEVAPLTDKPTWIIDPIDGTTNFASGCPMTCVSIGFCDGGKPVMGVAFSPKTRELYLAVEGKGSYRNGERISTKDGSLRELSNSVVCFEFGYARSVEGVDNMVNAVKRILNHGCRSTRSYGSGVLDICYVASGRLDVVYTGLAEEGWKPWDYCAAMVIAEEAGCTIGSLNDFSDDGKVLSNSSFDIYSKSMICGVNTTVVEQCRKVVLDL